MPTTRGEETKISSLEYNFLAKQKKIALSEPLVLIDCQNKSKKLDETKWMRWQRWKLHLKA